MLKRVQNTSYNKIREDWAEHIKLCEKCRRTKHLSQMCKEGRALFEKALSFKGKMWEFK